MELNPNQSNIEINNHNKLSHEAYYALVAKLDPNIALLTPKKEFFAETFGFIQKHFNNQGIFLTEKDLTQISERVVSDIIGFGPLDHLIADERITEILVNDLNHVYVEIDGRLYRSDVTFQDQDHILRIAQRIAMKTGRRVDEKSPMVDARLPDGSRVNIITPPVCLNGPVISIRKFPKNLISLETMVSHGNLSLQIKEFLEMAIKARFNILISGGTGSGKTTLLNSLSQYIASDERVITIEDTAELQLNIPNLVRLEYRPPNIEEEGEITIRDLVRNSLRMRPDRILVGEVRGIEAIDMLQAMNTGHDGSLSTIHANSASDSLLRLENMYLMDPNQNSLPVIRGQITGGIDIIIHLNRLCDGLRRVTEIVEVTTIKDNVIYTQPLFNFRYKADQKTITGKYVFTKLRRGKKILSKLEHHGLLSTFKSLEMSC